jgi:hypothetical protein
MQRTEAERSATEQLAEENGPCRQSEPSDKSIVALNRC